MNRAICSGKIQIKGIDFKVLSDDEIADIHYASSLSPGVGSQQHIEKTIKSSYKRQYFALNRSFFM